jgi:long-chain acyl-CoA synthetase
VTIALLAGFLTGLPVQVVEADRSRRVPTRPPPAGTALIKQTVGSSGHRRCQFFSFSQIAADVDRLFQALSLRDQGVAVAAISVAHSYGLTTTILPMLLHGVPVHWLPTPFPGGVEAALSQHERVFLPGVPAIWKAWLTAGLEVSQVALAVSAGSPLSLSLEEQVRDKLGLKLHTLYGASECGAISYDAGEGPRSNATGMGTLLPGVTARVGHEGRLLVKSDAVGLGYDEPLPGEVFGRGQHLTWDQVRLTPAGLDFLGCLGAGINVASRKLSPEEITERIRAATGVRHIRVYGDRSRDSERVQDIVANLDIPPADLTPAFKAKACASLAPWEVPRRWHTDRIAAPEERRHSPARDEMPLDDFDNGGALPAV